MCDPFDTGDLSTLFAEEVVGEECHFLPCTKAKPILAPSVPEPWTFTKYLPDVGPISGGLTGCTDPDVAVTQAKSGALKRSTDVVTVHSVAQSRFLPKPNLVPIQRHSVHVSLFPNVLLMVIWMCALLLSGIGVILLMVVQNMIWQLWKY